MKLRKIFCIAIIALSSLPTIAQINTDQVLRIGRNALYFEDYVLSIQYFNQVIAPDKIEDFKVEAAKEAEFTLNVDVEQE